jgi:hypothetical protein
MDRKLILGVMFSLACSTQGSVTKHNHHHTLQNARSFKGEIDSHKLNVHSERIDELQKHQNELRHEIDAIKVNLGSSSSDEYGGEND